jgi:DNA-binding PadR family transcriptional regulator
MTRYSIGEFEELVLLAVRGLRREATGGAIQEVLGREAGRRASLGAIYAVLDRAQRKGLVESWLGAPRAAVGGRARRHYALTGAGELALRESRRVRDALWGVTGEAAT